ncbi:hypothetical protein [Cupriavidus malaysiensis]|uniref:hypothetical protein n=1 Tax=Cupriavidus malaysiensis TaxID=367825 RepID=UPI0012FFA813|nr:hypothetical protein [Cupriavidus malaysiensis]
MSKSIGSIAWPDNADESRRLLSTYMVKVVGQLGISFGNHPCKPASIVKGLISGRLSDENRRAALASWWAIAEEHGVRNFEDKEALIARLAICLLSSAQQGPWNLGDQLSWFLEVIGLIGADVDKAIDTMEEHFEFIERERSKAP